MKNKSVIAVEFSLRNLAIIFGAAITLVLAWQLRTIVFMVFLAFIINSSLRPLIDKLEAKRIPRILSVLVIYLLLIVFMVIVFSLILTQFVDQFNTLKHQLPVIINNLGNLVTNFFERLLKIFNKIPGIDSQINSVELTSVIRNYFNNLKVADFGSFFSGGVTQAFSFLNSALAGLIGFITVMLLSIYMLIRKEDIYIGLLRVLPKKEAKKYSLLVKKIEEKLGSWMHGQLFLMFSIGLLTWLGLVIPKFFIANWTLDQFALPLAVIAGFLEVVPNFGPIFSAIVGVVIAAGANANSPFIPILYIILVFSLIHQAENVLLVPKIMEKAVGLDPIITIVAMLSAFTIFNMLGVVLVIPILAVISIIIEFRFDEASVLNGE
ncbi:MAG: AI-2E family transporter [bacterium]